MLFAIVRTDREQNIYKVLILSTLPSGLFRHTKPTWAWRPTLYLQDQAVRSSTDVYLPFWSFRRSQGEIATDGLFVRLTNNDVKSRLTRSQDYQAAFGTRKAGSAFGILRKVLRNWLASGRIAELLPVEQVSLPREHRLPQQWANSKQKRQAFCSWLLRGLPDNVHPTQIPELDHHEVVYQLVAEYLGIDTDMCAAHGLRLYIAPESPEFIGLMKPNLPGDTDRFVTVRMSSRRAGIKLFYECMRSGESIEISPPNSKIVPVLNVVGVWVPTDPDRASEGMYGAELLDEEADMDDFDAVLV